MLWRLASQKGIDFDQKTLMLHSGGDSQRIPHQSLQGKIFASLPAPDFSVFESIYQVLSQIGQQLESGIVVACGDTPFDFLVSLSFHPKILTY